VPNGYDANLLFVLAFAIHLMTSTNCLYIYFLFWLQGAAAEQLVIFSSRWRRLHMGISHNSRKYNDDDVTPYQDKSEGARVVTRPLLCSLLSII
jgi:hypothetical protein